MRASVAVTLTLLVLLSACSIPQDPMDTSMKVRDEGMVVGLTENPPWVTRDGDVPGGVEIELVEKFAEQMGVTVQWEWGSSSVLLEALDQFELHLVIGGLTRSATNGKGVGLTIPYYESKIVIAAPPGASMPENLDGADVGIVRGSAVADIVRDTGARLVFLSSADAIDGPTALPKWQADELNLISDGEELDTLYHVMAVPPGENGWLLALDNFLQSQPRISP